MPHSVLAQDLQEAFTHLEPSYVEVIFDDAQRWAQRALLCAEAETALLEAKHREFLAAWVEHPVGDDEEDISDRAFVGENLRRLIEMGLRWASDARRVIDSGETSLRAITA